MLNLLVIRKKISKKLECNLNRKYRSETHTHKNTTNVERLFICLSLAYAGYVTCALCLSLHIIHIRVTYMGLHVCYHHFLLIQYFTVYAYNIINRAPRLLIKIIIFVFPAMCAIPFILGYIFLISVNNRFPIIKSKKRL